uniref:DNA 5'-3' helicase n=1 Tax=Lingulaulax polyedra TaxID=160621 RepID=A0A516AGC0_LINPO|nr:general transcription and DNA repair factor IIH helicase subunit XPD [Lingulodinium polyedra]
MGFTFYIEDLRVFFPYDSIYPEQYRYMCELKRALDAKGNCVLEMPTGTGKTVSLFSLITSYQLLHPQVGRLIYCTRTVPEMSKALEELKTVISFRMETLSREAVVPVAGTEVGASTTKAVGGAGVDALTGGNILAVGLSARRNMCVHPEVSKEGDKERVDEMCRQMTAPWVREQAKDRKSAVCQHYERYEQSLSQQSQLLESGIYTIEDLRAKGLESGCGWCPYFAARRLIQAASVVVLNYQYVLDPKVSLASQLGGAPMLPGGKPTGTQAGGEAEPSIVVFDEAHNIDDVCIEALSVKLNRQKLDQSSGNLTKLSNEVERLKKEDASRLQEEYKRLVQGLQQAGQIDADIADRLQSPVLPGDLVNEAIPGNIRRAEHFISLLRRLVNFLKRYLHVDRAQSEGPLSVVHKLEEDVGVDGKSLKFCHERLRSLLNTLRVPSLEEFTPVTRVADFVTLLGMYAQGFTIIVDPYPEAEGMYDPMLLLSCLDASLAIRPVLKRYQSVVLTSGTISPLEMYPKILGMTNVVVTESFSITMERKCLCPLIVTHGPDQVPVSSRFSLREDPGVVNNYGNLLERLVQVVPDGMVCFFTSYRYLEQVVEKWYETGVIARILQHKLVFIETKDVVATTYALNLYRQACDSGHGAVFLSVARGKVAEGIDFDRHYGRCVVLLGVPFQYTLSRQLRARLEFLREQYQIREAEFLNFDAMRQASQCLGRVIRSKRDYGVMILADQRYARQDKRSKIPDWIKAFMEPGHLVMATDVAVETARNFLLRMSQPHVEQSGLGASVLSPAALEEFREHEAAAAATATAGAAAEQTPAKRRKASAETSGLSDGVLPMVD